MESLQSSLKISEDFITKEEGFFSSVFGLSSRDKGELMNIVQYVVLCIVPVIISLKILKQVIPDEDDTKPSFEILFEALVQIIMVFVIFFFIHRIVVYFPTYSSVSYPEVSVFCVVLPTLFLLFTMQTKLGAKINILYDRLMHMLGFKNDAISNESEKNNNEKVSTQHNPQQMPSNPTHIPTTQHVNYAPPSNMSSHPYGGGGVSSGHIASNNPVNMPSSNTVNNYNQFPNEPMAANDFSPIGGSAFY